jgi:ribonuclease BN (tRNA processing enzyme)
MKLNILASAGSYPGPGRVCSGYLLSSHDTQVLLDLGNGALSNLLKVIDPKLLSGVIISHAHLDHYADMIGLYHYFKFAHTPPHPVPLYGSSEFFDKFHHLIGIDEDMRSIFSETIITEGGFGKIDNLSIAFSQSNHPPETYISRVSDGKSTFCYSADGDESINLALASNEVDLFLCESTWSKKGSNHPAGLHLDARAAGEIAQRSRVKQLVITHIAYPQDRDEVRVIVSKYFKGRISLAEDLDSYIF